MNSQLLRIVKSTIVVPCLLLCLVACTVKEDRRICPCILEVSFHEKENISDQVTLVGWSAEELFDVKIKIEDYPDNYSHNTPRTMVFFGAAKGVSKCRKAGHLLVVPEGQECDSLYAYCDYIDCTGETAQTAVSFHKQFATIHIGVTNASYDPGEYHLAISSKSCGIDMLTCDAVAGNFKCAPGLFKENEYRCRVSRQVDESMVMTVTHLLGDSVDFPLGEYINTIGYDWKASDLLDIYITLDIARGKVGVGVADWETVEDFELSTVEL